MAAADFHAQVQQMYISYYGRPADPAGLAFWADQFDKSTDLTQALAAFGASQEYTDNFGGLTNEQLIVKLYQQMFNRAPDEAGKAFYLARLDAGEATLASIAKQIGDGATGNDKTALDNKAEVAQEYTNKVTELGATYDSTKIAAAKSILAAVTDDAATVTSGKTAADAEVAKNVPNPGQTITLTAGTNIVGPEVEDEAFKTTDKNDLIKGATSALTAERTLESTDQIDGGEGRDTLQVSMDASFSGFTGSGFMKNVEIVDLTNETSVSRTFTASNVTDVEEYNLNSSKGAISLANVAAPGITVNINGQESGTAAIGFVAASVTGTGDAIALGLNGVGKVKATATENNTYVTVTANGIETANVTATGANFADLSGAATQNITVGGAGSLDVNAVAATLKTFDASKNEGGVTANLTAVTGGTLETIAGGSGSDTITAHMGGLKGNVTITTTGDNNTLKLTNGGTLAPAKVSGFQTLDLSADVANIVFSGANVSDVTKVNVSNSANDITLANLPNAALTVTLDGDKNNATKTVNYGNAGSATFETKAAAANVTAKTATVMNTNFTAANVTDVTISQGAYTTYAGTVTATKADTVTLNSASGKNAATPAAEQTDFTGTVVATVATSLVVDAQGKLSAGTTFNMAKATSANIKLGADATIHLVTPELQYLNLNAAGTFAFNTTSPSTNLGKVETLIVDTAKHANLKAGVATGLTGVNNVELSGSGADSQVTLGDLGAAANDKNITLTATGLQKNLSVDTMTTAASRNITVDVANVTGAVTLGKAEVTGGKTGSVTMTFGAQNGTLDVKGATAQTVTLDASSSLKGLKNGGSATEVTAKTAVVKGSTIDGNTVTFVANEAAHSINYTGGIGNDVVVITSNAAATSVLSGKVDLGAAGTNSLTIGDATTNAMKVDLSQLEVANLGTGSITVTAASAAAASEIKLSQYKDAVALSTGTVAADKVIFNAAGKNGEGNTITNFNAGATTGSGADGDILDLKALVAKAGATLTGVGTTTADAFQIGGSGSAATGDVIVGWENGAAGTAGTLTHADFGTGTGQLNITKGVVIYASNTASDGSAKSDSTLYIYHVDAAKGGASSTAVDSADDITLVATLTGVIGGVEALITDNLVIA